MSRCSPEVITGLAKGCLCLIPYNAASLLFTQKVADKSIPGRAVEVATKYSNKLQKYSPPRLSLERRPENTQNSLHKYSMEEFVRVLFTLRPEGRPKFGRIRTELATVDHRWPKVDQVWPNSATLWSNLASSARKLLNTHSMEYVSSSLQAKLGEKCAKLGQVWATCWPMLANKGPKFWSTLAVLTRKLFGRIHWEYLRSNS